MKITNTTGWGLLALGLVAMVVGHKMGFDKLAETGAGLISCALLAFQHQPEKQEIPKV